MVGMKRPSKTKVPAREEVRKPIVSEEGVDDEAEGTTAAAGAPPAPPSPASAKLAAAEKELLDLYIESEACEQVAAHFQSKLKMRQALYDAKVRRAEAAQKRKARGSAVLQLERIYQNETDLLRHKLQASKADAEAHNAEANWLAQQCRVLRLQMAKNERDVRKLARRAP